MGNFLKTLGNIAKDIINPAGAAIDAVGGIFGNLFNANQARKAEARQFQMQKDLMSYQNDMNRQNWQEVAEYNSPANQMKRLQEAGLNPNLVYGNGADATASSIPGVSGASAHSNIPQWNDISVSQPLAQYAQTQNLIKQNNLIGAQTDYTRQKATNEFLNSIGINKKNQILGYQSDYYGRTLDGRVLGIELDNILKNKESEYKDKLIEESSSRIALNSANIGLIEQKTALTQEQARKVNFEIEFLIQKTLMQNAEYRRFEAMTPYAIQELQNKVLVLSDEHAIKQMYYGNNGLIQWRINQVVSDINHKYYENRYLDRQTKNAGYIPQWNATNGSVNAVSSLMGFGLPGLIKTGINLFKRK